VVEVEVVEEKLVVVVGGVELVVEVGVDFKEILWE
jgi:hypothetical protein